MGVPRSAPIFPSEILNDLANRAAAFVFACSKRHSHRVGLVAVENHVEAFLSGRILDKTRPMLAQILRDSFPGFRWFVDVGIR